MKNKVLITLSSIMYMLVAQSCSMGREPVVDQTIKKETHTKKYVKNADLHHEDHVVEHKVVHSFPLYHLPAQPHYPQIHHFPIQHPSPSVHNIIVPPAPAPHYNISIPQGEHPTCTVIRPKVAAPVQQVHVNP
jgi:hypothetical protein